MNLTNTMMNNIKLVLMISLLSLMSCSNHFKYFGNTYPETSTAKIFFREADIDKDFEVIGVIYSDFKVNMKDSKVQKKIMNKVMQHGGDAAIFGQLTVNSVGSVTSTVGASKKFGKKKMAPELAGVSPIVKTSRKTKWK
jgi:hypothetical protein